MIRLKGGEIKMFIVVCVCVCVCARARIYIPINMYECVCVHVHMHAGRVNSLLHQTEQLCALLKVSIKGHCC